MREMSGAILILAASILIAGGVVADAITWDKGRFGNPAYVLGAIVGVVGLAFLFGRALRRAWDAIPVEN
jgi:hypothetical protein